MLTMYFYLSYQGGVERDMSVAEHHLCQLQFRVLLSRVQVADLLPDVSRQSTAFLLTLLTISKGNVLTRVNP